MAQSISRFLAYLTDHLSEPQRSETLFLDGARHCESAPRLVKTRTHPRGAGMDEIIKDKAEAYDDAVRAGKIAPES
jgi:hypothetical protein